jgi:predicted nucleic acid-binding protein
VASTARGFDGLGDYTFVAPPLFWSESLSAMHQALYRGVISEGLASAARLALAAAPIDRLDPPALADSAWNIANTLGWAKTYDAEYVALAQITGLRLLTRDERLARGASRVVRIVRPIDL